MVAVTTVLFDLDGTLSDSASGILASLRRAFDVNGLAPLSGEQERSLLGPPFQQSLPGMIGPDRVDDVIAAYREFYAAAGMYDTVAYDGIEAMLGELRARGRALAVATSKPEYYAIPIVEHLGLTGYFDTICGDTLDGRRGSKSLVVGEAVRRLADPAPAGVLMVGDRSHDVVGARAHGVGCIGAGWGYGSPGELQDAGALAVFAKPADLRRAWPELLGDRPADGECNSMPLSGPHS